jgi:hypothetical protein
LAPLSKSGGSIELEMSAWVEVAFLIEMVVDWRVDGSELLQTSDQIYSAKNELVLDNNDR